VPALSAAQKEKMVGLIKELSRFFAVEVLAYQAMGKPCTYRLLRTIYGAGSQA